MKKIILVVLMLVMVSSPCFAEEIETEGIFTIEGTLWRNYLVEFSTNYPAPLFSINNSTFAGYYNDTVYSCYDSKSNCRPESNATYIDTPVLAVAFSLLPDGSLGHRGISTTLLQPLGFGITFSFYNCKMCGPGSGTYVAIGIMFKVSDDWTPPEDE